MDRILMCGNEVVGDFKRRFSSRQEQNFQRTYIFLLIWYISKKRDVGGTKEEEDKHNSAKPHFPGHGLTAHSQLLLIINRIVEKHKTNEFFWSFFKIISRISSYMFLMTFIFLVVCSTEYISFEI